MTHIRKAIQADIPAVTAIYDHILTEEEAGRATVGWIRGVYPTRQTAQDALDAGDLFVLESDGVAAAAAKINQIQVPEYANAQWRYPDAPEGEIMVLHTLVVEPAQAGKGYGSAFVQFYEDYAREYGCSYLRMDTNAKNQAARKLYAHLGYWESGIVARDFNGIPGVALVCLEKKLNL